MTEFSASREELLKEFNAYSGITLGLGVLIFVLFAFGVYQAFPILMICAITSFCIGIMDVAFWMIANDRKREVDVQ